MKISRKRCGDWDLNFTVLSNGLVHDSKLGAEALGVLVFILAHPNNFELTSEIVQAHFKLSKDELVKIWARLKKCGYLQSGEGVSYEIVG